MEDNTVIDSVLAGRKNAYAELMRKYNQRLYRVGKAYLDEDADVEDAMQEAYVKAYQNLASFGQRAQFGTWLTRIMINECLRAIERKKRAQHHMQQKEHPMSAVEKTTPESESMNRELGRYLEKSILALPEKYRVVFMLREVEQFSIEEASEALEISTGNVKARLSRAKEMLRSSLMQMYPAAQTFHLHAVRCERIVASVMQRV